MNGRRLDRRAFLRGAVSLAGMGAASALVGCGPRATATPTAVATAVPATMAPEATSAPVATAVPEPTVKYGDKACVFRYMTGGFVQAGPEDNLIKEIQEEALRKEYGINVDIQFESAAWSDIDSLIELRLQTQGCDGVQRYPALVFKWMAVPGMLRDIEDALNEYGKHLLELIPQAAYAMFLSPEGKYMAIPSMQSTPCDIEFTHIRRDWCDKIDRDIPTTYEELEECLRLFKERNLGGSTTIPFTVPTGWYLLWQVYGPWTPEPQEQIRMLEEGKPIYQSSTMHPERLEMLQRWVKDGLMNPEWGAWDDVQTYDAMSKGIVGCIQDGHWLLNSTIRTQVLRDDPTQDWVQIFPPLGLKGRPHTGRVSGADYKPVERAIVVTSWAQCPEAIVALMDWENSSFENFMLCRYGIEGKHWEFAENGGFRDLRSSAPNQEYSGMRATGWATKWQNQFQLLPPAPGNEPIDPLVLPRVLKTYNTRAVAHVPEQGEYPAMPVVDRWAPYIFSKSVNFLGDMDTIYNEYHSLIINGEMEVEKGVQEFWDRWYAAGGETYVQEIAEQWNAFISAHPEWRETEATFAPEYWNTEIKYPERPQG